jgi:UDPglucose--hexose-1-phosphate uridylyltransferase
MSETTELRIDALSGRTVIVATGRAARPHTVPPDAPEDPARVAECPFCPGHEHMTPPELARTGPGEPGRPGWRVRVFPNLYPIVSPPNASVEHLHPTAAVAIGAHEVVVLSPEHTRSFARLDVAQTVEVMTVLRDRVAGHLAAGYAYAVAFVNHRRAAGASNAHPHAQVVALDFVPPEAFAEHRRWIDVHLDLLYLDLANARYRDAVLVDGEDGGAATWLPWATGSPFTVRAAHLSSGPRFDLASDDDVADVALALHDAMARLDTVLGDPPYNITVHTAAADGTGPRRWYIEVTPRTSVIAGFEIATGVLVNTMPSERAATLLREASA